MEACRSLGEETLRGGGGERAVAGGLPSSRAPGPVATQRCRLLGPHRAHAATTRFRQTHHTAVGASPGAAGGAPPPAPWPTGPHPLHRDAIMATALIGHPDQGPAPPARGPSPGEGRAPASYGSALAPPPAACPAVTHLQSPRPSVPIPEWGGKGRGADDTGVGAPPPNPPGGHRAPRCPPRPANRRGSQVGGGGWRPGGWRPQVPASAALSKRHITRRAGPPRRRASVLLDG